MNNGQIVLIVDCDMYSNNSQLVRDALCFFMDEQKGHEFAYVQFPQNFENVSKNDVYTSSLRILSEVSLNKRIFSLKELKIIYRMSIMFTFY